MAAPSHTIPIWQQIIASWGGSSSQKKKLNKVEMIMNIDEFTLPFSSFTSPWDSLPCYKHLNYHPFYLRIFNGGVTFIDFIRANH
jgi:hypothetical protein